MRTTLTIDDDVVALLLRLQKSEKKTFKQLVNDALRQGLKQMQSRTPRGKRYHTDTADLGRCFLGNLDDVAEVLAVAEGERFK